MPVMLPADVCLSSPENPSLGDPTLSFDSTSGAFLPFVKCHASGFLLAVQTHHFLFIKDTANKFFCLQPCICLKSDMVSPLSFL